MATKKDLIQAFRNRAGLTVRESALCVDALAEWMEETLVSGKNIELRGLGTFEVKQVSEKKYPTAFSAQRVIPAHKKIVFRPCQKLKESVWEQKA